MSFYNDYNQLKNKSRLQIYNNLISKKKTNKLNCEIKFPHNNNFLVKVKNKNEKLNMKTLEISKKNKLNTLESDKNKKDGEIGFLNLNKDENNDDEQINKTIIQTKKRFNTGLTKNDLLLDAFESNSDVSKNVMISELDIKLSNNDQIPITTQQNIENSNINKIKNKEIDFKNKIESNIKQYLKQNKEEKLNMVHNLTMTIKNIIKIKKEKINNKKGRKDKKPIIQKKIVIL